MTDSVLFTIETLRLSDALAFVVSTTLQESETGIVFLDVPEFAITREAGVILRAGGWTPPAMATLIHELEAVSRSQPRN